MGWDGVEVNLLVRVVCDVSRSRNRLSAPALDIFNVAFST